jgi:hypothetical protein
MILKVDSHVEMRSTGQRLKQSSLEELDLLMAVSYGGGGEGRSCSTVSSPQVGRSTSEQPSTEGRHIPEAVAEMEAGAG